jgi:hypothetical protein
MKKLSILVVILGAVMLGQCKSTPKKEEPPPTPVVAQPEPEPVLATRAEPIIEEEPMEVAVRPELAFREQPGHKGRIIAGIPYGTSVTLLDRSTSLGRGKWVKVRYDNETGYVFAKYLRSPGDRRSYKVVKRTKRKRRR